MASLKNSAGNVFVETGLCCNFESHFFTSQNAMYFRTRLNYFVQLSQLEDPRWPRRDLPCPPEVRLQHLRRQWRQCSHPQVLWINISTMFRISIIPPRYCPLNKEGIYSFGASLPQLKTRKNAAGNFSNRRCWTWSQYSHFEMIVGVELLVLRSSCEVLVKWSDLESSRLVCPPLHSALRKEESALSQVLCLILCSDEKIGTSIWAVLEL